MNKIEITDNAQEHIATVLKKDSAKYFRITVLGLSLIHISEPTRH